MRLISMMTHMRCAFLVLALTLAACGLTSETSSIPPLEPPVPVITSPTPPVGERLELSDDEWRTRLTNEAYKVLRRHGTEAAFCGGYTATKHHGPGIYHCAGCGNPLFDARTKFESGTGWPSFWQPLEGRLATTSDTSYGMVRTEVHCARCDGHMGHSFDDGPAPTNTRYCINAVSLIFVPEPKSVAP